jgi:hypothetical protein
MKPAVTSLLQPHDTNFFYARIQALLPQWDKCLNVKGDNMVSGVYHLLHMCCMYREVLASVSVTLFFSNFLFNTNCCAVTNLILNHSFIQTAYCCLCHTHTN